MSVQEWVMSKPYFTPKEMHEFLGMGLMTVYRHIEQGKLKKMGAMTPVKISREELIKYLDLDIK